MQHDKAIERETQVAETKVESKERDPFPQRDFCVPKEKREERKKYPVFSIASSLLLVIIKINNCTGITIPRLTLRPAYDKRDTTLSASRRVYLHSHIGYS